MAKQNYYNSLNTNFITSETHGTPFWTAADHVPQMLVDSELICVAPYIVKNEKHDFIDHLLLHR
jgi:hypothetical protein